MSNMTDTNWPDPKRPGAPMFPERDGLHVILWGRGGNPSLLWWVAKKNAYTHAQKIMRDGPYIYANEVRETWIYCGPVLTCTQIEQQEETIKALQVDLSAALEQIAELTS